MFCHRVEVEDAVEIVAAVVAAVAVLEAAPVQEVSPHLQARRRRLIELTRIMPFLHLA